ncbi:Variant surface glycoprotein [Trypanosoma congolense IL3000]|uniref:Variant surface glycoprotein n=1 Tax=Trypanosoma congolense (strain IL3000) TaxID=1068625 RepID=F9WAL6_TRYCI|nr:Variant surface glycoprotein [Trypanosoma congolense IL3000]CCD15733.1 Variant surface glycoprotein [Trypanosoma congolense IL3000]
MKREPRTIGKGMLAVVVVVMAMVIGGVVAYPPGSVFNDEEYKALCDVFQASLDLWNASRTSSKKLDNLLEKHLCQALFGKSSGGKVDDFKEILPQEYNDPGYRLYRCGYCDYNTETYPGKSITHDLMCLCTPGKDAEPFYGYYWWIFGYYHKENGFKLCGRLREEMGVDLSHGWYAHKGKHQAKGLENSWKTVTMGCFNGWKNSNKTANQTLEEKVKRLSETLDNFKKKGLKKVNGRYKLGGFDEHNEADGSSEKHIHVRYGTCKYGRRPWWKKLEEVLQGKNPESLLFEHSVNQPAAGQGTGTEDDEEEGGILMEEGKFPSHPGMEEGPTSKTEGAQGVNATQTSVPINSTVIHLNSTRYGTMDGAENYSAQYQMLRSSTSTHPPASWLLCATFLI